MTGCWWDLAQNSSNRGSKKGSKMTHLDPSRAPQTPFKGAEILLLAISSVIWGSGALGGVIQGSKWGFKGGEIPLLAHLDP